MFKKKCREEDLVSWKELIEEECDEIIIYCTLTTEELNEKFDCGYGGSEGKPFTEWTENYVLFPVVYDGLEWVGKVPRNPCNKASSHFGGE